MSEPQKRMTKKEIQEILKRERREYEAKRVTEVGWVNIHINLVTKQLHCSEIPSKTRKRADLSFFVCQGFEKVGCFKIKYTKIEPKK